jgi:hypothetical protein
VFHSCEQNFFKDLTRPAGNIQSGFLAAMLDDTIGPVFTSVWYFAMRGLGIPTTLFNNVYKKIL